MGVGETKGFQSELAAEVRPDGILDPWSDLWRSLESLFPPFSLKIFFLKNDERSFLYPPNATVEKDERIIGMLSFGDMRPLRRPELSRKAFLSRARSADRLFVVILLRNNKGFISLCIIRGGTTIPKACDRATWVCKDFF